MNEHPDRSRPAGVDFADHVFRRDADTVEEDLVERRTAGHVAQRADGDARRMHVDHEHRDAVVLRHIGVGASDHCAQVREPGNGGPDLLAADLPAIAVLHGARLQAGHVRARARLREELAPDLLATKQRPYVAVLLLLCAEVEQSGATHPHADTEELARQVVVPGLLVEGSLVSRCQALAAIGRRPGYAGKASIMQSALKDPGRGEVPAAPAAGVVIRAPGRVGFEPGAGAGAEVLLGRTSCFSHRELSPRRRCRRTRRRWGRPWPRGRGRRCPARPGPSGRRGRSAGPRASLLPP